MLIHKLLVILISIIVSIQLINGHGYTISPMARQVKCSKETSIWWPANGDGIVDNQCRSAFKYVYNKGNNPQYQFVQINEYSINIPNYAQGASALEASVTTALCSAGATTASNDKSGMSIPGNWSVTNIPTTAGATTQNMTFKFCATATHNPNYWEFYVSKPGFNPSTTELKWSDLTLFQTFGNTSPTPISDSNCSATQSYVFELSVPTRFSNAVILSRWQRVDPVGETFINCHDFKHVIA